MHVNGLSLVESIDSQGANIGRNGWHDQSGKKIEGRCSSNRSDFGKDLCALAAPGETRTDTWYAKKEGTFFLYSMGAPAGGEGDGGQLGLGLFGAINVQPRGAKWYRSQVTHEDLKAASLTQPTRFSQPVIDYEAAYKSGPHAGDPILNMLKCQSQDNRLCELVHSDLNAVIDIDRENGCEKMGEGNACGRPYREFSVIFHEMPWGHSSPVAKSAVGPVPVKPGPAVTVVPPPSRPAHCSKVGSTADDRVAYPECFR